MGSRVSNSSEFGPRGTEDKISKEDFLKQYSNEAGAKSVEITNLAEKKKIGSFGKPVLGYIDLINGEIKRGERNEPHHS